MKRRRATARANAAVVAVLLVAASPAPALGQVYKCAEVDDRTTYSDTPCGNAATKLRLPSDDARQSAAGPTVCAQLQDEIKRLGAQADRNAERGRKESAAAASRRQALGRQYAERCAGIARSKSGPE
jgi:hypothetical protein